MSRKTTLTETELSILNSPHMLWHKLEISIFIFLEDWAKRKAKEWTVFSSFYPGPPLILKNTNILTSLESLYGPLNWLQCLCWPCGQNRVLLFQKTCWGTVRRSHVDKPSSCVQMCAHFHKYPFLWFPIFFKENQDSVFIFCSSSHCGRFLWSRICPWGRTSPCFWAPHTHCHSPYLAVFYRPWLLCSQSDMAAMLYLLTSLQLCQKQCL